MRISRMCRSYLINSLSLEGDDCMDAGGRATPGAVAEGRGEGGRSSNEAMFCPSPYPLPRGARDFLDEL